MCDGSPEQTGPIEQSFVYVDIGSVNKESKLIETPKTLSKVDAPSRARQLLRTGDVLVSMTRPNLNAVALVTPALDGSIGSTGFHVLRTSVVDPRYIYYFVQSDSFLDYVCACVQGVVYPAVRPKDIQSCPISRVDFEQSKHIADEIEKQFSRIDVMKKLIRRADANALRCRRSLLTSAFERVEQ